MTKKDAYTLPLSQIDKHDTPIAGGKGANLGEMIGAKFPVPNGFVVTSHAYFTFLEEMGIKKQIKELFVNLDADNPQSLFTVSKNVQALIMKTAMPPEIQQSIRDSYKELQQKYKAELVAVRSSATAEDLPDASFAGQQDTYLNIEGEKDVIHAVQKGWASLFTPRAIFYRVDQHYDHFKVGICMVVQKMVESKVSGVMFTINPVNNDKHTMIIEAVLGLGEMIVQGKVTPDHFEVDKREQKITNKIISHQSVALVKTGKVTKEVAIKAREGEAQKIADKLVLELAKIGQHLERHYYFPQDIEWAYDGDDLYIVQTRPITTISAVTKNEETAKNQANVAKLPKLIDGAPASPGIASGKVVIVKNTKEIGKVKQGDVLFAPMTNPDYVPAMRKASAIVTDLGGRTCFAGTTKILTDNGFMSMQEAYQRHMSGESLKIFSYDYQTKRPCWKNIIGVYKNRRDAIRVSVSQRGNADNTIDVTPDHKFFTYNQRELVKITLEQILAKQAAVCLVDYLPKTDWAFQTSNKLAYLLGAIATDGNIYLKAGVNKWRKGTVTFTQKQCEYKAEFIQTVTSYFDELYKPMIGHEKHTTSVLRGRQISGSATDYRCYSLSTALEMKSLMDNLSVIASSFSEEAALHFLAGVLDGDGTFYANRIQLYISKKHVLEGTIISCLRLGILMQVTTNREIYNVQILERLDDILKYSKKVTAKPAQKYLGTKLFAARQLFEDVIENVNYKGRIRPYVEGNLLIDARKIKRDIMPIADSALSNELSTILQSALRMQRISYEKALGTIDVYNIEVQADRELDHNYVVFTDKYSPLLVSNSHAAIVSRELGIPAVVGTGKGTKSVKENEIVTVDGSAGIVYKGAVGGSHVEIPGTSVAAAGPQVQTVLKTATKVYCNLGEPELAEEIAKRNVDGVGLFRAEFMMAEIGVHPKKLLQEGKQKIFVEKLVDGMVKMAGAFNPRPVIYRGSDFKTNEYRNLKGGELFEPKEANPMIGYRGAFRYISDPKTFNLELEALKIVRNKYGLRNIALMIPFVRTVHELEQVKKLVALAGLHRSGSFHLWMMCEIPANVILLDDFIEAGIDGISIGSNDLTQLTLGVDRDNAEVAVEFDERNEAVTRSLEHIVKTARKHGITVSICGQAPSVYPEITELLVHAGATSVSVSPDTIEHTREVVYNAEKVLVEKRSKAKK